MLSRVADSLYWMSRYLERAENTAAPARRHHGPDARPRRRQCRSALGAHDGRAGQARRTWSGTARSKPWRASWSSTTSIPLPSPTASTRARENARQVREEISTEQWQRLNRLFHHMHSPHAQAQFGSSIERHAGLGRRRHSSLPGRRRLHHDSRPGLAVHPPRPIPGARLRHRHSARGLPARAFRRTSANHRATNIWSWSACCAACTAFEAYCQVYTADLSAERILEFLLLNRDFPHAIRYCVDNIRTAIESIQRTGGRRSPDELIAGVGKLHAMLGYTTIREILAGDSAAFLHNIREQCLRIHELIYRNYVQYSIQSALAV